MSFRGCATVFVLASALLAVFVASDSSRGRASDRPSESVEQFPLASELPSNEFVKLRGTVEGSKKTATFFYRVPGRRRVCLTILVAEAAQNGEGVTVLGGTPSCKGIGERSRRLAVAVGLNEPKLRLLAFGLSPEVEWAELTKSSGVARTIRANSLSKAESSQLGIQIRFKYAVVRDVPPCFDHLKTLRINRSAIGTTGLAPC
jgi:hypothetical protein